MLPEVEHADAVGLVAGDERAGRLREQHLPAVARRADARRTRHVDSQVALLAGRGLTGVKTHAYTHFCPLGPRV
jgi:hypothetical protein